MISPKHLRESCIQLHHKREETLKTLLNDYFEYSFIQSHRPWRAIIGNKRCKPIPVYKDLSSIYHPDEFKWPNFSEDLLRKLLEDLGFVITENKISLTVPPCEKGKELTFAQEQVKKINQSHSKYCSEEKARARKIYSAFIASLDMIAKAETNHESSTLLKATTFEGYTLFEGYEFEQEMSRKCFRYLESFMTRDGIEIYRENGEYKGIKVYHQIPN